MATVETAAALDALVDAVHEMQDAAEFERLMSGDEDRRPWAELKRFMEDSGDCSDISHALFMEDCEELTALDALRRDRAVARLTSRYPAVWDRVVLANGVAR